jgi:CheY-like chemotaxis protein
MGGHIAVESEYGKGSTFTVSIPQAVHSGEPFAAIEEPEKKKVLVYEGRAVYAQSVCWSLENMGVSYTLVRNQEEFTEALGREAWSFVFSGYGLYDRIKPVWDREESFFPGEKKPLLVLMVEWGNETRIPGVRFVPLPVQALSIAGVLNRVPDQRNYAKSAVMETRFIAPEARILVVDDMATNLKVAEGLLSPYRAPVDVCLSGAEAIELVKRNRYDMVFMDHMMPEMDGIEAVAQIRVLEGDCFKTVPIIALTANAMSGMREMFLSRGFSDFLAKPIEISRLDEILACWIPKKKQIKRGEVSPLTPAAQSASSVTPLNGGSTPVTPPALVLPGVDIAQGIALCGGTPELYKKVLSQFRKDAEERLPLLRQSPAPEDLPLFVTQVHALKSASAIIGASGLSAEAAALEAAGKAGDQAAIAGKLPAFADGLAALTAAIGAALESGPEDHAPALPPSDDHTPLLRDLAAALETQNAAEIDRLLEELLQRPLDKTAQEEAEQISNLVLMAEYGRALEAVRSLLGGDDHYKETLA